MCFLVNVKCLNYFLKKCLIKYYYILNKLNIK